LPEKTLLAYRGDEAYIFVSYAHSDSAYVIPELHWLKEQGFNIWYDEGISPGSRWTDDLAERIRHASVVLYYVTPNSANSENCRNEVDYALEYQRQLLAVHLQQTELPGGQKLALGGRQAIMKYELPNAAYRPKLAEAISDAFGRSFDPDEFDFRQPRPKWWLPAALIAIGLAFALFLLPIDNLLRSEGTSYDSHEPLPVLIGNFTNNTGEALFDGTLEEALRVGIEGAPFVTSYSRASARRTLATLIDSTELNEEGTRLVAVRENVKLVLIGEISSSTDGYELRLKGMDPITGEVRIESEADAPDRLSTMEAVSSLATEVRRALGDITVERSNLEESFSASSLEAISNYVRAQELATNWKHEEAVDHYERAVDLDPQFGRALSGWAYSKFVLGQRDRAEELFVSALGLLDGMTDRERYRTLGLYYSNIVNNFEKATETYESLLKQYPADAAGLNNLSVNYFQMRRFADASDAGRRLLRIYPNDLLYLNNYALFSMYAGDLETAVDYANQVIGLQSDYHMAYLPLALASLVERDYQGAANWYDRMGSVGPRALLLANMGKADMLIARGDHDAAAKLLQEGISRAAERGDAIKAVTQAIWLAEARHRSGDQDAALHALSTLDTDSMGGSQLMALGEVYVELGELTRAEQIVSPLSTGLEAERRAAAGILRASIQLTRSEHALALDTLNGALALADAWSGRLLRGQIYLQAGQFVAAWDEFEHCLQRQGESLAVFLDDVPTYRRIVEVNYWLARALQAQGMTEPATRRYQEYLRSRDLATKDPRVNDAERRLEDLLAGNE